MANTIKFTLLLCSLVTMHTAYLSFSPWTLRTKMATAGILVVTGCYWFKRTSNATLVTRFNSLQQQQAAIEVTYSKLMNYKDCETYEKQSEQNYHLCMKYYDDVKMLYHIFRNRYWYFWNRTTCMHDVMIQLEVMYQQALQHDETLYKHTENMKTRGQLMLRMRQYMKHITSVDFKNMSDSDLYKLILIINRGMVRYPATQLVGDIASAVDYLQHDDWQKIGINSCTLLQAFMDKIITLQNYVDEMRQSYHDQQEQENLYLAHKKIQIAQENTDIARRQARAAESQAMANWYNILEKK